MSAETKTAEHCIPIHEDVDVVVVRRHLRELGVHQGLSRVAIEALATASTELARNILDHAVSGELSITALRDVERRGIAVVAKDRGPGIAKLELALEDGYSTAAGLGLGLSSARRLVDDFVIESRPGEGTIVTLRKWSS